MRILLGAQRDPYYGKGGDPTPIAGVNATSECLNTTMFKYSFGSGGAYVKDPEKIRMPQLQESEFLVGVRTFYRPRTQFYLVTEIYPTASDVTALLKERDVSGLAFYKATISEELAALARKPHLEVTKPPTSGWLHLGYGLITDPSPDRLDRIRNDFTARCFKLELINLKPASEFGIIEVSRFDETQREPADENSYVVHEGRYSVW